VVYSIHRINISTKIQLSNQFGFPHFTIPSFFPSTIQWIFYPKFVPRNNAPTVDANKRGECINPNPHLGDGDQENCKQA
jgi:hypothetical protein